MFTPCPDGSFSAACSRRKSIASRIVVSRNSICGMMMLFILLVICAVPRTSPSPFVVSGRTDSTIFPDRLLPCFLHFPKLPGARLVVRFLAVLIFGVVDSFLASARGGVVRIERQHLVVAFHRLVVLAGLIIAVGFGEQTFDFIDFIDEAGIHGFVEVTGLSHMGEKLLRFAAVRIVTV